jgi:hypothetical protein
MRRQVRGHAAEHVLDERQMIEDEFLARLRRDVRNVAQVS